MHRQSLTANRTLASCLSLFLASGCSETTSLDGGGTIVPPYPGTWISELDEEMDIQSAAHDEQYFAVNYEVTARIKDPVDRCGIPMDGTNAILLEGMVLGNRIELYPQGENRDTACLTGTFNDMITLDATVSDGSSRRFRGVRVQVNLTRENGIWISDDAGKWRVAFVGPNAVNNNFSTTVNGCILFRDIDIDVDVANLGEVSIVKFTGEMQGYDTQRNLQPRVDSLQNIETGETVFTDMTLAGPDRLTGYLSTGEPVTLYRVPLVSDSDIDQICTDFP